VIDIEIKIENLDHVVATLSAMPERVEAEIVASVEMLTGQLKARIIERLTSGNPLFSRSGRLVGSVQSRVEVGFGEVSGEVSVGPTPYARVQEYGGKAAYDIVPVNARVLAFLSGGKALASVLASGKMALSDTVFAMRVHHPPLPERSYARASLADLRPAIFAELKAAVARGVASGGSNA
jgi:hypothetical protein